DGKQILTSREALIDIEIPESILIIGGGGGGVEFAYIYSVFGSRGAVVEMEKQLLPGVGAEGARELERVFRKRGIEVLTGTKFHGIEKFPSRVEVSVEDGGGLKRRTANKVLVAVGRTPLSTGLGLEALGVELNRGYIKVDEQMRTANDA